MIHDYRHAGEAVDLVTVPTESITGFNIDIERDLKRKQLLARFIIFIDEKETIYTPESWQLRKVEHGLALPEDLSRTPLDEYHGKYIMEQLYHCKIRPDSVDERDLRIKDLKDRIKFLEAIVIKSVGITREDMRLIRDE
jgi:hypothetical protein